MTDKPDIEVPFMALGPDQYRYLYRTEIAALNRNLRTLTPQVIQILADGRARFKAVQVTPRARHN